jgi:hypothetical protein
MRKEHASTTDGIRARILFISIKASICTPCTKLVLDYDRITSFIFEPGASSGQAFDVRRVCVSQAGSNARCGVYACLDRRARDGGMILRHYSEATLEAAVPVGATQR